MFEGKAVRYIPEPTAAKFHADSTSMFRGIMGPVGSGKTSACCWELFKRSFEQEPFEGVRRTRWAVIRASYPELKSTTIRTWQEWFPNDICPIVYDVPIRARMQQQLADGTMVDMEVLFLAIDHPAEVDKLKSLEITGAYINEASEIDEAVLEVLRTRVPRFPSKARGGATWSGIIADTNPPKVGHWWYRFSEELKPKGFAFYKQPPALIYNADNETYEPNPDAENVGNLPNGFKYYLDLVPANSEDTIRTLVCAEYGGVLSGKPVYPKYNERVHVADKKLQPDRELPLFIGIDWGLHPAAVFCQVTRLGCLTVLDSLSPKDVSLEEFLDVYVKPLIISKYRGFKIEIVGDPAGRGRSSLDKKTPFQVMGEHGFRCVAAPSNSFITRRDAVEYFLSRQNGLQVSPDLTSLREGFRGGYHYSRLQVSGVRRHKETPEKNEFSHEQDALQYIALYVRHGLAKPRGQRQQVQENYLWA